MSTAKLDLNTIVAEEEEFPLHLLPHVEVPLNSEVPSIVETLESRLFLEDDPWVSFEANQDPHDLLKLFIDCIVECSVVHLVFPVDTGMPLAK